MKTIQSILTVLLFSYTAIIWALPEGKKYSVQAALKVNDWDTALDLAEELVADYPKSSEAHFLLAHAIRIKMEEVSQVRAMFSLGDYKEALATAIQLDPANIAARTEQIGFFIFAPGVAGGDKELAQQRINDLRPFDAFSALEMEVQLAAVNKDPKRQELLLKEMLSLQPKHPSTLMNLAGIEIERKAYPAAEAWLLKIDDSEDPGWPLLAQYQRAKWRILAKQNVDQAIALMTAYAEQLPQTNSEINLPPLAAVWWRMALAYENKGEPDRAIELLKTSLKADKDFEPAEQDLERLSD